MVVYLLIAILILGDLGCKFFGKKCSTMIVGKSVASYALYNIFMGVVACIFFFFTGGCTVSVNLPTLGYALLYALTSLVALVIGLVAYHFASISAITLITGTCGLIATSSFGALLFDESFAPSTILRIVLMLTAVVLSFWDRRVLSTDQGQKAVESKKKRTFWIIPIVLIMLAYQSAEAIIQKYFSIDTTVTNENSFFFLCNAIIVIVSFLVFVADSAKHRDHGREARRLLMPCRIVPLVANILSSATCSLVGILLIARMPLSIYSPVSSAVGMLSGVIGSLACRERLGSCAYLGAALALITVFL
ncbi:MAG: hypothetical protein E7618_07935 [Ruminococcaceae bacterium]|nr:hypothetical protein [Oscillospiraceae bacterium]